jgi:glycosyltransferase involved in cell wall biosynthesis
VIPYGVDRTVFRPADRQAAREALAIDQEARVFLIIGNHLRAGGAKDYKTIRTAISLVVERIPQQQLVVLARGEDAPSERVGSAEIRFIPWQKDDHGVVRYFHAADVYLHAAHVDTFPFSVLEALACGIPVVATAVGGIPEQIKSLTSSSGGWSGPQFSAEHATGILVGPQNATGMADAIVRLMRDEALRARLGRNAAEDAGKRFDLRRYAADYVAWYRDLCRQGRR